jgi:hypothetical protein
MSKGLWDSITGGGGEKLFVDSLSNGMTLEDRRHIAENLKNWLVNTTRKKQVVDLDQRLVQWGKRFDKLAENCSFSMRNDEVVVMVADGDADTLRALKNGTSWFDPCNNVVNVMISALLKS